MRDMKCKLLGDINSYECYECYEHTIKDDDLMKALWGDKYFSTRALCVRENAVHTTEPYTKIKDYVRTAMDELIDSIKEVDGDAVFELDNVIWVSIDKMKEYVPAIKGFINDLTREKYETVNGYEIQSIGLEGTWYRRMIVR